MDQRAEKKQQSILHRAASIGVENRLFGAPWHRAKSFGSRVKIIRAICLTRFAIVVGVTQIYIHAATTMKTNREFVIEFIKKFKEATCLWQVTNKYYRNKEKRKKALEELLKIYKTRDPEANIETIRNKIQSLRSCFRKENNKVKRSKLVDAENVHVPKLWYYDRLLFLTDEDNTRIASNNQSILSDPFEDVEQAENFDYDTNELNLASPSSVNSDSQPSTSRASSVTTPYKSTQVKTEAILSNISKRFDDIQPSTPRQRYEAFGEHIAEKLRSLPDNMASHCQKIINDAIYMSDLGKLNESSHIVTEYLKFQ